MPKSPPFPAMGLSLSPISQDDSMVITTTQPTGAERRTLFGAFGRSSPGSFHKSINIKLIKLLFLLREARTGSSLHGYVRRLPAESLVLDIAARVTMKIAQLDPTLRESNPKGKVLHGEVDRFRGSKTVLKV